MLRAAAAEGIGTAFLLAIVVGSGIMGERLAEGNAAIALLANAIATGAGLYALIVVFGPITGAHLNPVVSAVNLWNGALAPRACAAYVLAQLTGAFAGVAGAHAMFGMPLLQVSSRLRPTAGECLGEFVATFGLVLFILLAARFRPQAVAGVVACYITSAYWFTSSTSFANPAVALARATTDTFAGIAPESVPLFLAGQIGGAASAAVVARWVIGCTTAAEGSRADRPGSHLTAIDVAGKPERSAGIDAPGGS